MENRLSEKESSTGKRIKRFGSWSNAKGWLTISGYFYKISLMKETSDYSWKQVWRNKHKDTATITRKHTGEVTIVLEKAERHRDPHYKVKRKRKTMFSK